jgi:S-adenosylmethionine synthetase
MVHILSALEINDDPVEFVERKGLGHPDTICDALAEGLSRDLCREYQRRFGEILHHNVDKALLCGGRAAPAFGGGHVIAPIDIYLAGRAISEVGTDHIPISEIAIESSRSWLRDNMHALSVETGVRIHAVIQPGSQDLQSLFLRRGQRTVPLANDSVIAVGHAPLSPLEQLVLAAERRINGRDRYRVTPAWGEDVKVMGVRIGDKIKLTIACAMIGRYLADLDEYLGQKLALSELAQQLAAQHGFPMCEVHINSADDAAAGRIYLTVTGTSAEAGDDGQVGRGNRVNGLITPCRPMSLEAAAGKNPVSHVGKIYNVTARDIAETLVAEVPEIAGAQCLMVSQIGSPITDPAVVQVKLATRDVPVAQLRERVEEVISHGVARIPALVDEFVLGKINLF